jgi:ubiquinone/menaquinone biosynthesis C-methylase UbiE
MNSAQQDSKAGLTSQTAVSYFDNHADHYAKNQYGTKRRTFINSRQDQLMALLSTLGPVESALDAGCGPGNLVPELARRCERVCAMDAAPRMIEIARAAARESTNVEYHVGSIDALPYADASFDLVCSAGVIEYLRNCDDAIAEMYRVLRPGGLLILPTTNLLAPAHWLRPVLEPVARIPAVARWFGLQPGNFRLWYHVIPRFKRRLARAGFAIERERHFYLTLPRPLDRLFPEASRSLEGFFDRRMEQSARHLAEGYIAVARKPGSSSGLHVSQGSRVVRS